MPASKTLPNAWEPLTPRGVAAFAHAPLNRMQLVQLIIAVCVAAAVVWFLYDGCYPTVRTAIENLPDAGEIRDAQLDWHGASPQLLAEGRFLAFSVDLNHTGDLRSPADVQIEFGKHGVLVFSLLGYSEFGYPSEEWIIGFNRGQLEPWWGAWEPALLAIVFFVVFVGLQLVWAVMAMCYTLPVSIVCYFANRDLNLRGSWKLASAALMPGALMMIAGILLYDFGVLDLTGLGFVAAGHIVLGWIYLLISPLFLPRHPAAAKSRENPFAPPENSRSAPRAGKSEGSL